MGRYIDTFTGKSTLANTIGIGNPCLPGILTREEVETLSSGRTRYEEYMKISKGRVGSGDLL